jgi:hypothetical protein
MSDKRPNTGGRAGFQSSAGKQSYPATGSDKAPSQKELKGSCAKVARIGGSNAQRPAEGSREQGGGSGWTTSK